MKVSTISEQVTSGLREGILQGRWKGQMPGRDQLAKELGVSIWGIQRALEVLEKEGLLGCQGRGKRRVVLHKSKEIKPRAIRVGILPFGRGSSGMAFMVDMRDKLISAGYDIVQTPKTLYDLGMELPRIQRLVNQYEVDAWIVVAGDRAVMEWFASQPTPVFSFFGSHSHFPIAGSGPDKLPAIRKAVDRLVELGHRRIVFMLRSHLVSPPSQAVRVFSEAMEAHGLSTSSYNVPKWSPSGPDEFHRCLDSLLAVTPPTAMIIDESESFIAARQYLSDRGFRAPERISLVCTDNDRAFSWYRPRIAHISWDVTPIVRRAVRWVDNISRGKEDRRKTFFRATFVEGGTIGPVPHC